LKLVDGLQDTRWHHKRRDVEDGLGSEHRFNQSVSTGGSDSLAFPMDELGSNYVNKLVMWKMVT
jgi:hypothetical protein